MKLTEMQRKEIVALYTSGEATMTSLAQKYQISKQAVSKIVKAEKEFAAKVDLIKNDAEESVAMTIKKRLEGKAEGLLEVANLAIRRLKETVPNASPRDAAGALKISMDALFQMVDRAKGEVERGSQENALDAFVTAMRAAAEAHKND